MPKGDFTLWHGSSPINLLHIFRTLFPRNTSGWLLLKDTDFLEHMLSFTIFCIFYNLFHFTKIETELKNFN